MTKIFSSRTRRMIRADSRAVIKELKRIWQHVRKFSKRLFNLTLRKIKFGFKVSVLGLKVLLKLGIQCIIRGLKWLDKRIILRL